MAKTKSEITEAQKATLDARQKLELAEKNHAAKPGEGTLKAIANAKTHLAGCVTAENRERFVRVGGGRVKKIRAAIRNLAGVAQPRSYVYSEEDITKAESVLQGELKTAMQKLRLALTKGGSAKVEDDFTFS